jgi:hypothetical protein
MLAPMPAVSASGSPGRRQVLQECRTFRLITRFPERRRDYARHKLNQGLPLSVSLLFGDDWAENVMGAVDFPPTSAALAA